VGDSGLFDFAGSLDYGRGLNIPLEGVPQVGGLPDFTQFTPGPYLGGSEFSPGPGTTPTFGDRLSSFGGRVGDVAGKIGTGLEKEFSERPLESFGRALGLGTTGFNIANQVRAVGQLNQQTANVKKAQEAARAAAAPAVAAGTQDITRAQAGQLQPAMEASLTQWAQQAKADLRAKYAAMGLGNSSDIASEEAKIDLMVQSMRGQLLQGEESLGLQGVSTGVNAAIGGGQLGQNQQALLTSLIAQANQSLGLLQGRQPSAA